LSFHAASKLFYERKMSHWLHFRTPIIGHREVAKVGWETGFGSRHLADGRTTLCVQTGGASGYL
jgi:hypothetical protein